MKIPLVIASELWHVGDLDKNTQGERQSYEGNLFSASACPNAWASIARLGGKQYALQAETMLVDMISALKDDQYEHLRLEVIRWATANRLIEHGVVYVVTYEDSEADPDNCLREIHFETEGDALVEAQSLGEMDSSVEMETRSVYLATETLLKIHGLRRDSASSGLELALIEWARAHLSSRANSLVKGVYWDEKLDELGLSAPRAGMFSTKGFLQQEHLPDDEDCLAKVDFMQMERYQTVARHELDDSGVAP